MSDIDLQVAPARVASDPNRKAASLPRLWDEVAGLLRDTCGVIQDRLHLAVLEARQAGEGLATMITAAVILAVLLSTAWLGLMGAGVFLLTRNGVEVVPAVLVAVAMNVVLAAVAYGSIRRAKIALQFPATIGAFQPIGLEDEQP